MGLSLQEEVLHITFINNTVEVTHEDPYRAVDRKRVASLLKRSPLALAVCGGAGRSVEAIDGVASGHYLPEAASVAVTGTLPTVIILLGGEAEVDNIFFHHLVPLLVRLKVTS